MEKLRSQGIPLGEYVDAKIFYGIKTGLNEAFVIDQETRNNLIAEDPNSARVIKSFLAGRDIKSFCQPQTDKFLILFKSGDTYSLFGKVEEGIGFTKMSEKYPAVMQYLEQFKNKARKRYDQGNYWWELRSCDYYSEFEKNKIIYPNICKQPEFTFDDSGQYTNQKCFIIPGGSNYLLGILNSKITFFLFKHILPMLRGGFYEPGYKYLKDFPIVDSNSIEIVEKVQQILLQKKENPAADTTSLEAEIDQLVYELYGLTEEEIGIVEGSVE